VPAALGVLAEAPPLPVRFRSGIYRWERASRRDSGLARKRTTREAGEIRRISTGFGRAVRSRKDRDDCGLLEPSCGVPSRDDWRSSVVCRLRFRKLIPSSSSIDGVLRFRRRREPSVRLPSDAGGLDPDANDPSLNAGSEDLGVSVFDSCGISFSGTTVIASPALDAASSLSKGGSSSSSAAHSGHFHLEEPIHAGDVRKRIHAL
jgi:hypothetical protein